MRLQKMLFFAHAFYFKRNRKPLVSDPFVAWQHGPVIESLYHKLKKYGDERITDLIICLRPLDGDKDNAVFPFRVVTPFVDLKDNSIVEYLNSVWNSLASVETWRLRALSHKEGGAWYKTVGKLKDENGKNIDPSNDLDVRRYLPRNLTILDDCIMECGR